MMSSLLLIATILSPLLSTFVSAIPPKVILHVIVDDLGWGDVAWHRDPSSRIENPTPHMAALASAGVELNRHYVHKMCTPSRSSYLSGRLPVHVQTTLANPEEQNAGVPRNMTSIAIKLKALGYSTHIVGKWDLGMATPMHTPEGRGFDTSLIYFEHKVDYWDQTLLQSTCQTWNPIVDLWDTGAPAKKLNGTKYVEYLFQDRVLETIANHNMSSGPLYIQYDPHIAHCPLQVPSDWLAKFNYSNDEPLCSSQTSYIFPGSTQADYRCRNQYEAMVALLDSVIGNVTDAIKARGWWNESLMVLHSDNGGPVDLIESGSNNSPLRGGKYSDFEGGIRAAAFASGGYLPSAVQGTIQTEIIHIADWYATYCGLAGGSPSFCVADGPAAESGLPAIDSLDVWPLLSGINTTSPRIEIPVDVGALIQGRYKLLIHDVPFGTALWEGPTYPNASSSSLPLAKDVVLNCKTGCLFDLLADPTEHDDIAAAHPGIVTAMAARITTLEAGFYSNSDVGVNVPECAKNTNKNKPCACFLAQPDQKWEGYFGPYQL